MRRGTREYAFWGIAELLIVVFAMIPLLWIISLSLKSPATVAGVFSDREMIQSSGIIAKTTIRSSAIPQNAYSLVPRRIR